MKTLIAVLIGSSMALSFSAEATPCADLWVANPQSKSEAFIRVSQIRPDITDELRAESIKLCERQRYPPRKASRLIMYWSKLIDVQMGCRRKVG